MDGGESDKEGVQMTQKLGGCRTVVQNSHGYPPFRSYYKDTSW